MNIKIHSSEINRMMKTISQCVDTRDNENKANIEIGGIFNSLYIHASNGTMVATMSTPMLGLDDERFCVDGQMFARVCSMCGGDIEITTNEKVCTIKGTGRTRLPIVEAVIPKHQDILDGKRVTVAAEDLARCYGSVAHAVASESSRIQLTGILTETVAGKLSMTALDGFQMSIESAACEGDDVKLTVPAGFLKLVSQASAPGEQIDFFTDERVLTARTESMMLTCGLITGDYPDVSRILPKEFATECVVNVEEFRSALKSGSVINSKQNLIKLYVEADHITVTNNCEEADYEAEIPCGTHGNGLKIAFNQKYMMAAINAVNSDTMVMRFNSSVTPCVISGKDQDGIRLVLPVRVEG